MSEIQSTKFIIENTPVGLLSEMNGYMKILNGTLEFSPQFKTILQKYEEDHFKQVPLAEDTLILSKFTKDKEGYYYDQTKQYKLLISPLTENFEKLEKISPNFPLQVLLDKKVNEYKEKYYTKDKTSHNVYFEEKGINNWVIKILISSHIISLPNFVTGEWISYFFISNSNNSEEYEIEGKIKIFTYYYEDNNTQFNLEEEVKDKINAKSNEEIGNKVIEIIEKNENKVHEKLTVAFNVFQTEYTKPLRRKLPITGMKMNWSLNQIALK